MLVLLLLLIFKSSWHENGCGVSPLSLSPGSLPLTETRKTHEDKKKTLKQTYVTHFPFQADHSRGECVTSEVCVVVSWGKQGGGRESKISESPKQVYSCGVWLWNGRRRQTNWFRKESSWFVYGKGRCLTNKGYGKYAGLMCTVLDMLLRSR